MPVKTLGDDIRGVQLYLARYSAKGKDYAGMVYRTNCCVDEANAVMRPFLDARKALAQRELDYFLKNVDPQTVKAIALVERWKLDMQDWDRSSWLAKTLFRQPEMPPEDVRETYKTYDDLKSELSNRAGNCLMDMLREDGEGLLRDVLKSFEAAGFVVDSHERESNGEYDTENFILKLAEKKV